MKPILIVLIFILLVSLVWADKRQVIYLGDGSDFSGRLLFGTDSLLYVWTGLNDFDAAQLKHIIALPYSELNRIDLNRGVSWKTGIKKSLPLTLGASTAIVLINFKEQDLLSIATFMGLFNLMFSIPAGGIISLGSQLQSENVTPSPENFDVQKGKYKKYLLLHIKDSLIIDKLILEVKP